MMTPPGPPIQCSIVLKDVPVERLVFESFPDSLSEGYNTTMNPYAATGVATADFRGSFGGGKFNSFNLDLDFVAGLHPTLNRRGTMGFEALLEGSSYERGTKMADDRYLDQELLMMESKVRWLQALGFPRPKMPRAAGGRNLVEGVPPDILITIGRFMTISGVVVSADVTWKSPFHPVSARPYAAQVRLSVKRYFTFYPDWYDIVDQAVPTVVPFDPLVTARKANILASQLQNQLIEQMSGATQSQPVLLMADNLEKSPEWMPNGVVLQ